jgi:hypothetical protein
VATDKKERLAQAEQDFFNLCNLRDEAKKGSAEWKRHTRNAKRKISEVRKLRKELGYEVR